MARKLLEDFDCGPEFLARVNELRRASEIESELSHRVTHVVRVLEMLAWDDEFDAHEWNHFRHELARAGLTDPNTWPSWCLHRVAKVGDSDGMEQVGMRGVG